MTAETLKFDRSWDEQGFLRLWSNDCDLAGRQLRVFSDVTVSRLYRSVPKSAWNSNMASWGWSVSKSVVATDLTRKGGDDRNLAIYFIFMDHVDAEKLSGKSVRRALVGVGISVDSDDTGGMISAIVKDLKVF